MYSIGKQSRPEICGIIITSIVGDLQSNGNLFFSNVESPQPFCSIVISSFYPSAEDYHLYIVRESCAITAHSESAETGIKSEGEVSIINRTEEEHRGIPPLPLMRCDTWEGRKESTSVVRKVLQSESKEFTGNFLQCVFLNRVTFAIITQGSLSSKVEIVLASRRTRSIYAQSGGILINK